MTKKILKILSKAALLIVTFGFFQPVACSQNGFELSKGLTGSGQVNYLVAGLGLYVVFFAAVISIVFTLILLILGKNICAHKAFAVDLILLLSSIIGGAITILLMIDKFDLDIVGRGFYIIIAGWIGSLVLLLCSKSNT